jgi:hypothetical protein
MDKGIRNCFTNVNRWGKQLRARISEQFIMPLILALIKCSIFLNKNAEF